MKPRELSSRSPCICLHFVKGQSRSVQLQLVVVLVKNIIEALEMSELSRNRFSGLRHKYAWADRATEAVDNLGKKCPLFQNERVTKCTPVLVEGFFAWLYAQPNPENEVFRVRYKGTVSKEER